MNINKTNISIVYRVGAMAAMPIGGRLTDRIGGGLICIVGLAITIVATVPFVFLPANANLVAVELSRALRGIGVGLSGIPSMTAAFRAAPDNLTDATITANILQRVGGSLGSATIVIVIARTTPQLAAFQTSHALLVTTASIALVTAVALAISERRESRTAASPQSSGVGANLQTVGRNERGTPRP
ncbi:hypothetical protein RZS28_11385 [Methylocapsa polymorpha]|uniref:Major facilitator superfamily (MFS) profile domain-containing protein n=1 Tax=Methylocapsa polymorpha TaxID=3080828 RepID=A0ABZ0HMA9_9HYPH|nr:hypothetical protein RZS28_11385 [Methylocapsa sp. RX1]